MEPYHTRSDKKRRSTMLGPSLAPHDKCGEFEPRGGRHLTTVQDCIRVKIIGDNLTKGHDKRTVYSLSVFRLAGQQKWPARFALPDGNSIVFGKYMTLVTTYSSLSFSADHETTTGVAPH